MVSYGTAFAVFIVGIATAFLVTGYILINYFKFKNDPFEGEN